MFDYRDELQRRITQFAGYLQSMDRRTREIVQDTCFMIFEEHRGDGSAGGELVEKRQLALEAVRSAFFRIGGTGISDPGDNEPFDLPDEGWRGDDSLNRFIQFDFQEKWFRLDMSLHTLFRPEAEEILRHRTGFFYLADRKQFIMYKVEDVERFNPFEKVYIYGDERSAAEDMAFIFFQVWKFPVDSRLYVSSASFHSKHKWEQGVPIE